MGKKARNRMLVGGAGSLTLLVALFLVVEAFGGVALLGGNVDKARRIAAQLQADAIANPNPTAASSSPVAASTAVAGSKPAGSSAPAPAATHAVTHPVASSNSTGSTGQASAATGAGAARPAATASPKIAQPASLAVAPAPPLLRPPTSAEIAQAIQAVHSVVPFYTPTPADIASAGTQVCLALYGGKTFSQVQSVALDMVGAGSYAWMIPSSVTQVAIQTLVALYCPTNASKVTA